MLRRRHHHRFEKAGGVILQALGRNPYGIYVGSLFGVIRNWLGIVGLSYLLVDDEPLLDEIIDTVGTLCYQCAEAALKRICPSGARQNGLAPFDFAHFWEDISFRSGPLISPRVFRRKWAHTTRGYRSRGTTHRHRFSDSDATSTSGPSLAGQRRQQMIPLRWHLGLEHCACASSMARVCERGGNEQGGLHPRLRRCRRGD